MFEFALVQELSTGALLLFGGVTLVVTTIEIWGNDVYVNTAGDNDPIEYIFDQKVQIFKEL